MDEGEYVECPDCEGKGSIVVDMRWRAGYRGADKWDDVWGACKTCEGEGKLWKEREHADK